MTTMTTETTETVLPVNQDQDNLAAAIATRVEARKAAWKERVEKAEELKNIGNELFKKGDYAGAARKYIEAHELDFTQANYLSNLAAAFIKMEQYGGVELSATDALGIQPRHMKARFRRLQGREKRGLLKSALKDARVLLRIDPESTEAKTIIEDLETALKRRQEILSGLESDPDDWEDEYDFLDDEPNENEEVLEFSPEDWSESEDSKMVGNKIPCRHYNHLGCLRGANCKFSHAADDWSVRDRLGQNVCTFYLINKCKFGDEKCNYSHSKAALPPKGWWDDPAKCKVVAETLQSIGKRGVFRKQIVNNRKKWWREADKERNQPKPDASQNDPSGSKPKKGGKKKGGGGKKKQSISRSFDAYLSDYEDEYGLYGMSREDEMELMCQGVKPWDDDAFDVLAVLNSY